MSINGKNIISEEHAYIQQLLQKLQEKENELDVANKIIERLHTRNTALMELIQEIEEQ